MHEPKDIFVRTTPPLIGALGASELEHAAGAIILACQERGAWGSVTPREVGLVMEKHEATLRWGSNPFFRPDFFGLVKAGHAVWADESNPHAGITLTEACIAKLAEHTKGGA